MADDRPSCPSQVAIVKGLPDNCGVAALLVDLDRVDDHDRVLDVGRVGNVRGACSGAVTELCVALAIGLVRPRTRVGIARPVACQMLVSFAFLSSPQRLMLRTSTCGWKNWYGLQVDASKVPAGSPQPAGVGKPEVILGMFSDFISSTGYKL